MQFYIFIIYIVYWPKALWSVQSGCTRGCVRCYGFLIGPPDPVSNIRPVKSDQPGSNEAVRHYICFPNCFLPGSKMHL